MMSIAMTFSLSRRFGTRYERGVLASSALVIFAVVITIADASRRIRQPVTMTDGPILYYIHDPEHLETDKELATWAFDHWAQASEGRIRFESTEDRQLASIEVAWTGSSVPGRYGEMRRSLLTDSVLPLSLCIPTLPPSARTLPRGVSRTLCCTMSSCTSRAFMKLGTLSDYLIPQTAQTSCTPFANADTSLDSSSNIATDCATETTYGPNRQFLTLTRTDSVLSM